MNIEKAKELIRQHASAVIGHYQSVNEESRKKPESAAKRESNAVFDLLEALSDSRPSQQDCDDCMA